MLTVYLPVWPMGLTQTAQGARLIYGAASELLTADRISV